MNIRTVRGRFAPTPSGRMHLGNLSTLLVAWLEARSAGGEFLLRIEDLDQSRCRPEYTLQLLRDMETLGFDYDGEPVYQSRRGEYYSEVLERLSRRANIYECFCSRAELHAQQTVDCDANAPHASTPVYSGRCKRLSEQERELLRKTRRPALRIEVPCVSVSFDDLRLGRVSENLAADCGDFILRRSDGGWAYQLAVVADDIAQEITQVVRGHDLAQSTPRQIWLFNLLGAQVPRVYATFHCSARRDGRRLSKRDKSCELGELLQTLSPQQIVGKLAWMLGLQWSQDPVTPAELVKEYRRENLPARDIVVPKIL